MSVVDDVKARIDIVDIVGSHVALQKSGVNFKAPCPFHSERTPSFFVFPERGTWRCFGACATGGDAFTFVQKIENLTFGDALRRLAERTGVTIEPPAARDPERERKNERLGTMLDAACDYFHRILTFSPAGEEARRYLVGRGISDTTVADFRLGLSPNGWEVLKSHLTQMGYGQEEMLASGLLVQREQKDAGSYDRFRGRLMFPIRDVKGSVIGFGARSMDGSQPKYLNSPETPLFDKSGILYALDRAQETIRATGRVVLVEGYMDALQAHQAGFTDVVAVMGTSLTERQVAQVRRSARRYTLALDPDNAGEEATRRSLESAWHLSRRVAVRVSGAAGPIPIRQELPDLRILRLPEGRDPDEVIRDDPGEWQRAVEAATPILEYLISWESARPEAETPAGKMAVTERIYPLIASLENPFEQDAAFQRLASALNVDPQSLEAAAGRPERRRRRATAGAPAGQSREGSSSPLVPKTGEPVEDHLLGLVLVHTHEAWTIWNEQQLPPLPLDCFHDAENAELWRVLTSGDPVEEVEAILSARAERLRAGIKLPLAGRILGRALGDLAK
ncbi:MAG: DNA primase, partial [Chloroflexi bacterium]|nr:DNA primase [Chloroflexota bacterium]